MLGQTGPVLQAAQCWDRLARYYRLLSAGTDWPDITGCSVLGQTGPVLQAAQCWDRLARYYRLLSARTDWPGITGCSVLGQTGLVSVHCGWVRQQVGSAVTLRATARTTVDLSLRYTHRLLGRKAANQLTMILHLSPVVWQDT